MFVDASDYLVSLFRPWTIEMFIVYDNSRPEKIISKKHGYFYTFKRQQMLKFGPYAEI